MFPAGLKVVTVVSEPFGENTYIAWLTNSSECVVVDPGLQPDLIEQSLREHGLTPAALLVTHGHADHFGGVPYLKRLWPAAPVVAGRHDADKFSDAWLNMSAPFGLAVTIAPPDLLLEEGQRYAVAGFDFQIRLIPGHSSGHIVFVADQLRPMVVFGGDVLMAGSVGRCDFPGGSFEQLAAGIHRHLFTLADDTVVLAGHGPPTTIGREKRHNPFVGEGASLE